MYSVWTAHTYFIIPELFIRRFNGLLLKLRIKILPEISS